jgi:site-specific DNA recombinase
MSTLALRAVGYRRVSMREQVDGFSLDAQENNIRQYIATQGWEFVDLYTDAGISAKKDSHRPSLEKLMNDVQQHRFDVVVVDKVDRFYRHLRGLLSSLDYLNSMDIAFVSVQERLDFTTVWGKLTLTVLGTLAEIYIDNLRQETRKGKLQRARDGLWNGNISYGYCKGICSNCKEPNGEGYCPDFGKTDKSDGKHLILHPVESKVVRLIYDWYLSDLESDGHIAHRLLDYVIAENGLTARSRGIPGQKAGGPLQKESVRGILTNIFYTGMVPYYGPVPKGIPTTRRVKEVFPGKHPAIVAKKEYDRVQEIRKTLGCTPLFHQPTQTRIYPLSGLLRCGYCGRVMRGSSGKNYHYYRDTTHVEKSGNCPQCSVRADAVEHQVLTWLNTVFQNQLLDETHVGNDQQVLKIEERYNRVKELYISGQIEKDVYDVEKSKYANTIQTLREKDNTAIIALFKNMRCQLANWQQEAPIEKRRLLQLVIEAVYIKGSVLVGVQPTFSLLPLTTMVNRVEVCTSGPDGIRTRDLGLDRAACLAATPRDQYSLLTSGQ